MMNDGEKSTKSRMAVWSPGMGEKTSTWNVAVYLRREGADQQPQSLLAELSV